MKAWDSKRARGQRHVNPAMAGRVCEGFDHCTYYHDLDSSDTCD